MPENFECITVAKKALYKYSSFPFLFTASLIFTVGMDGSHTWLQIPSLSCQTSCPRGLALALRITQDRFLWPWPQSSMPWPFGQDFISATSPNRTERFITYILHK